jgi:hypothetical protein
MKNFTLIALCAMLFSTGSLVAQPTTVAPTPTKAMADVLSIYSDAYTSLAGTDFYPDWSQATPVGFTDIVVAGDNIKGYTSLSYQGTQFASAINVSTYQNLHIDLWSPNCAAFDLYLIGGGETKVTLTPSATGWNSYDVPLSSYSALTLGAIIQFKFVATGTTAPTASSSSVYVDNIYFWKPANVPTLSGFAVANKLTTDGPFTLTAPTSPSSGAFTYTSSNPSVATVSGSTVTIVGAGVTTITANQAAAGAFGVGSTSAVLAVSSPGPAAAAPVPTKLAADVISLFSNTYTNNPTDTWATSWSSYGTGGGTFNDIFITGNDTKKYTNLNYAGVTFEGASKIDATLMTNFHLDLWTPDATGADGFKVKLVDFGANGNYGGGDDTESLEIPIGAPGATANSWSSYDLPLSAFTGLASRAHLAQMVLVTSGGKSVWIDNVYFYKTAPPAVPMVAAPTPTTPVPNVIPLYSGAYTDPAGTSWNLYNGGTAYSEVSIAGNATQKYDNLNYSVTEMANINATPATTLHVDVWTASAADFKVKLVDFGANGTYNGPNMGDDTESELSFTTNAGTWTSLNIPLANFTTLAARAHLRQFIISTATTTGGRILAPPAFYVDNIYFFSNSPLAVELTNLTAKSINKTTVLNWQTASEKDNQGFTVERSLNGTDYAAIGQVKGFGTTNTVRNYTFTDATPTNGVNYYRLRQADFNGKETLSKVVSVISGKNFLVLKNTLVQNLLDVTVGEETKGPLSIFNVSGQLVYSAKVQGNQLLDVSALTSGLYIVRTEAGDVSRFVKQ